MSLFNSINAGSIRPQSGTSLDTSSIFGGGGASYLTGQGTTASSSLSNIATTQQQSSGVSLFGSQQPATKSIGGGTSTPVFGQSNGSTGFGWGKATPGFASSPLKPLTTPSSAAKKFLPGRPSLQDVLAVAPQWKDAFEKVNKEILMRDEHLSQLKSLLRELKTKNETQKALLEEKLKVVQAHQTAQHWIESEIESALPVISKLQRQCTTLSESCERTIAGGTSSQSRSFSTCGYQPLTVPQPEYLRFVSDLGQRVQLLQDRADSLSLSISLLSDELRKGTPVSLPAFTADIKTTLSLLMDQYRQIKLRQLGLHEELQASIDRYKQTHQLGLDFDRYLAEDRQTTSSSKTFIPRDFSLNSLHQLPEG